MYAVAPHRSKSALTAGFTLIEISIVLVIIGLIIGGILVGRDLISAAQVRAQMSQIEKYQMSVNIFRSKFNALPGDMNATTATAFGFTARGAFAGQGDGNGVIEGVRGDCSGCNLFSADFGGETEAFWTDLSTANLVDGGFSQYNILAPPASVSQTQVGLYMPAAKIGHGNYVYVWSGGWQEVWIGTPGDSINYFSLAAVIGSPVAWNGIPAANVSLTVQQAYNIDNKIDDGLPQTGRVTAMYNSGNQVWAAGGNNTSILGEQNSGDFDMITGGPVTSAGSIGDGMAAGVNSCYDGSGGLPEKYSMQINGGNGPNCALSFRFQFQ
jgi:prepilin-type N-terminal cleavage/methylation domain-containing protein